MSRSSAKLGCAFSLAFNLITGVSGVGYGLHSMVSPLSASEKSDMAVIAERPCKNISGREDHAICLGQRERELKSSFQRTHVLKGAAIFLAGAYMSVATLSARKEQAWKQHKAQKAGHVERWLP